MTTPPKQRAGSVVILAAGHGKRMKSAKPKVLHPLCGRPMIAWVLDQALALEPERIVLVTGHGAAEVEKAVGEMGLGARVRFVRQEPQLGTGHALQVCLPELGADPGVTVVLYGDMPCLRPETLRALVATQAESARNGMAILTAVPDEPRGFGRILRDDAGHVTGIVEERDASPEQREIDEVNLGVYAFDGPGLVAALPKLSNKNAQGEYYLTDVLAAFVAGGRAVRAVELEDHEEGLGVNTLAHLAEARWALQLRILEGHLENGVYIEDPATTYIDHGVEIGAGTRVLPCSVIRSGVRIGKDCEVGPFAQLRVGAVLEDGAEIGNFVEVKNTRVGAHAKAKHLSYLGDGEICARSNIGAGTIFANYDGVKKHKTKLGERVFVGSGSVIVAPNTIGDGATTGAGAIVTRDSNIGAGEVWVGVPAKRLAGKSTGPASGTKKETRS
ncbi:MAG: NTP transferase domain-containing protein [Planctomycetota bacterium]|nr:NTP transferase domain-containing protein [Planctomycetota bacterium]